MKRVFAPIALALLSSGCVTVYQPLRGLQRPAVVELQEANFEGVRVEVRCPTGPFASRGAAAKLCRSVQRVFSNQGALISYGAEQGQVAKPDLIVNVESRLLSDQVDRLAGVFFVFTASLAPWTRDTSIAQDITISDGDGFVLATDSLQARFVTYFGLGVWVVNALLDLIVREPDEKLAGTGQHAVISRDFFSHLSQLAFHARTRALVLRGFEPAK